MAGHGLPGRSVLLVLIGRDCRPSKARRPGQQPHVLHGLNQVFLRSLLSEQVDLAKMELNYI